MGSVWLREADIAAGSGIPLRGYICAVAAVREVLTGGGEVLGV